MPTLNASTLVGDICTPKGDNWLNDMIYEGLINAHQSYCHQEQRGEEVVGSIDIVFTQDPAHLIIRDRAEGCDSDTMNRQFQRHNGQNNVCPFKNGMRDVLLYVSSYGFEAAIKSIKNNRIHRADFSYEQQVITIKTLNTNLDAFRHIHNIKGKANGTVVALGLPWPLPKRDIDGLKRELLSDARIKAISKNRNRTITLFLDGASEIL